MKETKILAGVVLGGVFAFLLYPIGGIKAQNIDCQEGYHEKFTEVLSETGDGSYTVTHYDMNVSYTLNEGDSTEHTFTGVGLIKIVKGTTTFVILDRNLGADKAGIGCQDPNGSNCNGGDPTYGWYYKWGNNHGFASGDLSFSSESAGTWTERNQGPCPDGYHVPSKAEWVGLANMLGYNSNNSQAINRLRNELLIPFAGSYGSSRGAAATYWSSTKYMVNNSYSMYFNSNALYPDNYNPGSQGFSIRCFKNTMDIPSSYCEENQGGQNIGGEELELIMPTKENYEVNVGGETYTDELPSSMIVTINNVQHVENEEVLGEVSINFGGNNATFTELMQIKIPVEGATRAEVKVKHVGSEEYNYDGLTTNRNTSCSNGEPISSQYSGEMISVVDGYVSIYTCGASSFIAVGEGPISAHINLSVLKGALTIGTETGNLNLGQVNVSNNAQELSGSFGANSFWVEDMKGVESGYYTTISVTDLTGSVAGHLISADNVSLKTAGNEPSNISGATASEAKVIFGEGIKSWHSGTGQVNYFQRLNTATEYAGRVGKWGDNLQVKVNIPAHTPYDTYRGTITYTLYDMDS